MKQLDQFLFEARKNPEKNPKTGVMEILSKYKNDDKVFIHFSDIPKLGINPMSDFNTPLGIYSYPLKKAWTKYSLYNTNELVHNLPYASNRKHVVVFRSTGNVIDLGEYNSRDYDRDMDKIRKLYGGKNSRNRKKFQANDAIESIIDTGTAHARIDGPGGSFWNVTRLLAKGSIVRWNKIMRDLGYDGFIDFGQGIIHPSEPMQAVFMSMKSLKVLEIINNKKNNKKKEFPTNITKIQTYSNAVDFTTDFGYFPSLQGIMAALNVLFKNTGITTGSKGYMKANTKDIYYSLPLNKYDYTSFIQDIIIPEYMKNKGISGLSDVMLMITHGSVDLEKKLQTTNKKKLASLIDPYKDNPMVLIEQIKSLSGHLEIGVQLTKKENYNSIFASHLNETFDVGKKFKELLKKHDNKQSNNDNWKKKIDLINNSIGAVNLIIYKYFMVYHPES